MPQFRLFNITDKRLEWFSLDDHPDYLAASHTWSENVFDPSLAFLDSFGGQGFATVIRQHYSHVEYCWFDTVCIDQDDERDKVQQIPLMGRIFGQAICTIVFISTELGADQEQVDWLMSKIDGALAMCQAESWKEEGAYWQGAEGRKWLYLAQSGLLRLASTAWASRIWTLQEYVLAKTILWIGRDLQPLKIEDYVLSAIPDICYTLNIEECLVPRFRPLNAFFAGMANTRLKLIDTTRIMELPGTRRATMPVDEVYGVMAASGVNLTPDYKESKASAWARWCEAAVQQGHIRWALCPASSWQLVNGERENCLYPSFSQRHGLSGNSGLDTVELPGPTNALHGGITTFARRVGLVRTLKRLGSVHEPEPDMVYRDITLILFARSKWLLAYQIVLAFSGGRYNVKQIRTIAQVLVQSYARAVRCVTTHQEPNFQPALSSHFQQYVWADFMELQQSIMPAINIGTAYLCRLRLNHPAGLEFYTAMVQGSVVAGTELHLLDLGAKHRDGRSVLMVAQVATVVGGAATYHKVGMTLAVSDDLFSLWKDMPMIPVRLGGVSCSGCLDGSHPRSESPAVISPRVLNHKQRIRMLERRQEKTRLKLWSTSINTMGRVPSKTRLFRTRLQSRRLKSALMGTHETIQQLAAPRKAAWPAAV